MGYRRRAPSIKGELWYVGMGERRRGFDAGDLLVTGRLQEAGKNEGKPKNLGLVDMMDWTREDFRWTEIDSATLKGKMRASKTCRISVDDGRWAVSRRSEAARSYNVT